MSRVRAKRPPTEVGGAVQSPSLPLIWLAALALTTLLATLPGLLLLLARLLLAAAALLAAWATLTALTAALVLLSTVGHLDSAGQASVRWRSYLLLDFPP